MITHPHYKTEPWSVTEADLDLDVLAQSEALLALSKVDMRLGWEQDESEHHGALGRNVNAL